MNANELALQLGFYAETYDGDFSECLKNSATMLRQQQADLEHMWMANTVLQVEVEALKAKTLTDEEITAIWQTDECYQKAQNFARAILRKAQEK